MSAYNSEVYLAQAIESVLAQTFPDWELIIINDGSSDQTASILNSYRDSRLRAIHNPQNIGLTKSLNIGLRASQSPYVARLDSDDISLPDRLEKQYQFMETHPEVWLVAALAKLVDKDSTTFDYRKTPTDRDELRFVLTFSNPLTHSSIFFRRQPILDLGGYNENFRYAQDFDLYSRILEKGQIAALPEVLVKYRRHAQSVTVHQNSRQSAEDFAYQTTLRNFNKYLSTTSAQLAVLKKTLLGKPLQQAKLRETVFSCFWLRRLFKNYIKKERLSSEQIAKLKPFYRSRRNFIVKRFLRDPLIP